jgi:predicted site-specific integrase-resolvase
VSGKKLPTHALCARYEVCSRTINRWTEAGILPPPLYVNKRKYWDLEEVERCERERMAKAFKVVEAA